MHIQLLRKEMLSLLSAFVCPRYEIFLGIKNYVIYMKIDFTKKLSRCLLHMTTIDVAILNEILIRFLYHSVEKKTKNYSHLKKN